MVMQFATLLNNPQIAGAMGKLIRVGSQRAIQSADGDVNMVISNKFLVTVQGSGSAGDKIAYAQAVDIIKLTKM
jgi:NAD-dependent DNA ligase